MTGELLLITVRSFLMIPVYV